MTKVENISDVKQRILDVSRELFIRNGYKGTSVRDIAAASGTNVAHIKYYFQSKYRLFEIIFEDAFNILVNRVFSIIQSDIPFFEMIECWIDAYYKTLMEYPQIPMFIINEINQNSDGLVRFIKKQNPQDKYLIIANRLNEEIEKGTIKNVPAINFGLNIMSLCVFPFIFGKLVMTVSDVPITEYYKILEQHKQYVIQFVTEALKT
jgi:AcrR family transcriptional regulator